MGTSWNDAEQKAYRDIQSALGPFAFLTKPFFNIPRAPAIAADACNNNDLDGHVVRKVLLCDDSSDGQQCSEIRQRLGLDADAHLAIRDYVTDFPYFIKNTDENSGEYLNVSFEIHNYRQR